MPLFELNLGRPRSDSKKHEIHEQPYQQGLDAQKTNTNQDVDLKNAKLARASVAVGLAVLFIWSFPMLIVATLICYFMKPAQSSFPRTTFDEAVKESITQKLAASKSRTSNWIFGVAKTLTSGITLAAATSDVEYVWHDLGVVLLVLAQDRKCKGNWLAMIGFLNQWHTIESEVVLGMFGGVMGVN